MALRIKNLDQVAQAIQQAFARVYESDDYVKQLQKVRKTDNTPVTQLDLEINRILADAVKNEAALKDVTFYSEEQHSELSFPAAIIDPIDGTRGLSGGLPESAISFVLCASPALDDEHFAWIYNPFNGFDLRTDSPFVVAPNCFKEKKFLGLISRSDEAKGIFKELECQEQVILRPIGSIAYKLGLLAAGGGDFVISKTPKYIWDIAAGTYLCNERKVRMYNKNGQVKKLAGKIIEGPLLWCHEDRYEQLRFLLDV